MGNIFVCYKKNSTNEPIIKNKSNIIDSARELRITLPENRNIRIKSNKSLIRPYIFIIKSDSDQK